MTRCASLSALVPYTTLFRSDLASIFAADGGGAVLEDGDGELADLGGDRAACGGRSGSGRKLGLGNRDLGPLAGLAPRSEEHTSELQSLTNLVCRLLPEKKKA